MKFFLDTSVLVPVFLVDHPHHVASLNLYTQCGPSTASCASHSLGELYSTLTRLPPPHRATPDQAAKCVEQVAGRFRLISLEGATYVTAIQSAAVYKISGGTVYALLIAACALQSGAYEIYSWNVRHFERFGPEVSERLRTPPMQWVTTTNPD